MAKKKKTEDAPGIADQVATLKSQIEDAREMNDETPIIPVKRHKGGRPRKDGKPRKSDIEAMGPLDPAPASEPLPLGPPVEIPKAALRPALELPFALIAKRTGHEGFRLSSDELDELVPLVEQTVKAYVPAMHGPHAAATMLAGSLALLAVSKFMSYASSAAPAEDPKAEPAAGAPAPGPLWPTVVAGPGA